MSDTPPDAGYAEYAARLRADGFTVSDDAAREMWAAMPNLDALRRRVRRDQGWTDEPAHVFQPDRQGEPEVPSS